MCVSAGMGQQTCRRKFTSLRGFSFSLQPAKTWIEEYGTEEFENPYCFKMFLGNDECGDYLPCRALRDKYAQERRDVQPPKSLQDNNEGDEPEQPSEEGEQRKPNFPDGNSNEDSDDDYRP